MIRLLCHCSAEARSDIPPAAEVIDYIDPRTSPPMVLSATHFTEAPLKNWIQFRDVGMFCPEHGEFIRK